MLLYRSSGVMPSAQRSQFILPGSLSGAGLVAIHLLGGSAAASTLNLAPPQSGVAATQGMQPVGAVNFTNPGYASFPGLASTGQAPSLLSPYFETTDFTLAMAVQSTGVFTGSNVVYYANTWGADTTQGNVQVGTQIATKANGLTAISSWSASGAGGNQQTPFIAGDVAVEGNWHWMTYKISSSARSMSNTNTTAGLSSNLTVTGTNPRNLNAVFPWSFASTAVGSTFQQPCNIAAICLFSRALTTTEDTTLYQTLQAYLAGAQGIAI
jgi:hypothetical protein